MDRLMKDLAVDRAKDPEGALRDQWNPDDDAEDEDDEEDDGDINIIDRSSKFTSIRPSTPQDHNASMLCLSTNTL